jgi:hypothetical protein
MGQNGRNMASKAACSYSNGEPPSRRSQRNTSGLFIARSRYPPYGIYILNRVGSEDYIQSIYPEDDIKDGGKFLVIRSYPDFLANRMASIQPNTDGTPLDRFSPKYAVPGIDDIPMTEKGRVVAVGLWMLAVDSRESMMEVMKRFVAM